MGTDMNLGVEVRSPSGRWSLWPDALPDPYAASHPQARCYAMFAALLGVRADLYPDARPLLECRPRPGDCCVTQERWDDYGERFWTHYTLAELWAIDWSKPVQGTREDEPVDLRRQSFCSWLFGARMKITAERFGPSNVRVLLGFD